MGVAFRDGHTAIAIMAPCRPMFVSRKCANRSLASLQNFRIFGGGRSCTISRAKNFADSVALDKDIGATPRMFFTSSDSTRFCRHSQTSQRIDITQKPLVCAGLRGTATAACPCSEEVCCFRCDEFESRGNRRLF